jgi:NADPH2:quinone reductase
MRYVAMNGYGGPEVLSVAEGPVPTPGPGEVLIRVAAAGVNRPDVVQRQGNYPAPAGHSQVLGLEVAGTVGDRPVCALVNGGGYAEYVAVPEGQVLPVPAGLSLVEAAALPETCFTVWHNVFQRGHLQAGETLLVHGGTSGIGTVAIQLAKAFGARVIATAGSDEKCEACRALGADLAVNYKQQDFVEAAKAFTAGRGVELVLDMVGGPYIQRNFRALGVEGRLVQIAFLQGSKVELDLMPVMLKRLTVTGSTMRSRSTEDKAAIARELEAKVWPLIAAGRVKPVIHASFTLEQAAEAHRLMESSAHVGKIVLTT